ncbi:EAL domain-containing protein [Herminiimonas sp. NPDC097707]|uniref:EAL domain-containing protein n=1 Tax=Herminiimonas sp. NPDC097707 TaxID=3364007 RepID=UPI00383B5F83
MNHESVKQLSFSDAPDSFFRSSISRKTGWIFVLVLMVATANIVVVKHMLSDLNDVAATLNVSGKLRMLSQKIAFETLNLSLSPRQSGKQAVSDDIRDFEAALMALRQGGSVFGYNIPQLDIQHQSRLHKVRGEWVAYRGAIEDMLAKLAPFGQPAAGQSEFAGLARDAAIVLASTENLISFIVTETQKVQQRGLLKLYALLVLDILILAAIFVAIRRNIVRPLQDLSAYCGALAVGNYQVRSRFQSFDEIGQLSAAFNHSAQRIGDLLDHVEQERQSLVRAETMFRQLAENSGVGVYIVKDEHFHFANAKMAAMFGYEPTEMMASVGIFDIVTSDDRQVVRESIRSRLDGELREVHYERQACRKDGSQFEVEVFGSKMQIDGHDVTIGVMLDISRRKETEREGQLAALVYQNTSEAMMVTDAHGTIVTVNPAFTEITGYPAMEAIGLNIKILSSGKQDQAFYQTMWHAINTTGKWQGELWNRRKNGELYAERLVINTSFNEDGTVYRRIALFSDVTDQKQNESLIWEQANFDFLTGLPNRMMFHNRLKQEIQKSQRVALPLALIFLDLDNFKGVNDTLGHVIGDELLKQTAQRLRSCVRGSDMVARLGGDEFTLILAELSEISVVENIARKILQALAEPYLLAGEELYVSASIGITFYPEDAGTPEELLKNADQAMYAAKDSGRNRFSYFVRSMQEVAQSRCRLARDLRLALASAQFCLHYQPIVNLATGAIDKAEALIRWQHPERGMVNPAEFIPVAEETGMINALGDWVFRTAAQQAVQWRTLLGTQFQVSINTSAVQFRRDGIRPDDWLAWLQELGLAGDGIVIEITEGLLLDAGSVVTDTLLAFREAGIAVSIDDFGTGYSSLSYLKKFNIDYLKIDQSFVRNLVPESSDLALCEAMIVMAHKLGIKVIAEGVESAQQRDLLRAAGCDYAQGYLFSRPVVAVDFPVSV